MYFMLDSDIFSPSSLQQHFKNHNKFTKLCELEILVFWQYASPSMPVVSFSEIS